MYRMWAVAAVLITSVEAVAAGTLQIAPPKVEGNQVTIPVVLGGGSANAVSALDFRLTYNPEFLRPVSASAGTAASSADKRVMANVSAPGEYIVVMMGMNQATLTSGEVAKIVMERVSDSRDADWGLGIARPTLSSLDGAVIASEALPYSPQEDAPDKAPETPETPATPPGKPSDGTPSSGNAATQTSAGIVEAVGASRQETAATDTNEARAQLARAIENRDLIRGQIDAPGTGPRESGATGDDPGTEQASEGAKAPVDLNKQDLASRDEPIGATQAARGEQDPRPVEGKPMQATNAAQGVASEARKRGSGAGYARYGIIAGVIAGGLAAAVALARLRRKL